MEGHFSKFIDENKEGDFYILSSKFNLMSNRLEESLLNLKKKNIFKKHNIRYFSSIKNTTILFNNV